MGMNPDEVQQTDAHVVGIRQVNEDRLALMQRKLTAPPRILIRSAGRSTCCIFRVPHSMAEINGSYYHPHVVSVGPYHHGDSRLQMIEEHKWRFLGSLLKRTGLNLMDFYRAIQALEGPARESYSSLIDFSADELVEMLVLDGCFVIEILRKFGGIVAFEADDPLLSLSWIFSFFLRDFIRLENQVPFFILQRLFDLTAIPGEEPGPSLATLTLKFFNNALQRPDEFVENYKNPTGKHLLDLLRSSFIPAGYEEPTDSKYTNTQVIQCVSKLRRAGIKLRPSNDDSFLVIKFQRGVISMPTIAIDDFMSSFLQNCVAYEQCHRASSNHMTTYATFLDCLINTSRDVEYLCDKNIIDNYFGTDGEIARFINNLGKDVSLDINTCYLSDLFNEVNDYYRNHWHVHWASFKYTYFQTPWSFISAVAGLVLLVLTVAQTWFTIMSYVRPPKS